MFFSNSEPDEYDYDLPPSLHHSSSVSPFSPSPAKSISFADPPVNKHATVSSSINSQLSAMDRAKNIMDRYSNKSQSMSKFNSKKSAVFDEDDISISMDNDESDKSGSGEDYESSAMNASESVASDSYSSNMHNKHLKSQVQKFL
jgi:hypothetical protein